MENIILLAAFFSNINLMPRRTTGKWKNIKLQCLRVVRICVNHCIHTHTHTHISIYLQVILNMM